MIGKSQIKGDSKVRIKFPNQEVRVFHISFDSLNVDPNEGVISILSPLGRALLDKHEGDIAEYRIGNNTYKVEIIEII